MFGIFLALQSTSRLVEMQFSFLFGFQLSIFIKKKFKILYKNSKVGIQCKDWKWILNEKWILIQIWNLKGKNYNENNNEKG